MRCNHPHALTNCLITSDKDHSVKLLSSHVVVSCPGGAGTISEIALALKSSRPVILMNFDIQDLFKRHLKTETLFALETPEDVIAKIKELFV